jgi:hypothetical protein
MPKNKPYLTVYLSEDERRRITGLAGKAGLPVSRFIKRVCLGQELRSTVDQQAVLALLHSKGDLGRLGGLLKLHLADAQQAKPWHEDLRVLLRQVEARQQELAAGFDQVVQSLLRKNR